MGPRKENSEPRMDTNGHEWVGGNHFSHSQVNLSLFRRQIERKQSGITRNTICKCGSPDMLTTSILTDFVGGSRTSFHRMIYSAVNAQAAAENGVFTRLSTRDRNTMPDDRKTRHRQYPEKTIRHPHRSRMLFRAKVTRKLFFTGKTPKGTIANQAGRLRRTSFVRRLHSMRHARRRRNARTTGRLMTARPSGSRSRSFCDCHSWLPGRLPSGLRCRNRL